MKLYEKVFKKYPAVRLWVDLNTCQHGNKHPCEYSLKAVLAWILFSSYILQRERTSRMLNMTFVLANRKFLARRKGIRN